MKTSFKIQTCNGNVEIIKVQNGIAREIIAGDKKQISIDQAKIMLMSLNK